MSTMSPEFLAEIGETLYGPQWQSEMARQLSVSVRSVQRWTSGTQSIPQTLTPELLTLINKTQKNLDKIKLRLTRSIGMS